TARYLTDDSAVVRRGFAQALGPLPIAETVPLLEHLIVDRDPSVQLAAAASCRSRPDRWGIPILYTGLMDGYLATRQHCFDQLLERTGAVGVIPLEGTRDDRRISAEDFLEQHGLLAHVHTAHAIRGGLIQTPNNDAAALKTHEVAQKWESIRHKQPDVDMTGEDLAAIFSETDLSALEQRLDNATAAERTMLIDVVLPAIGAEYQALLDLRDPSVDKRRQAADRLAQRGGDRQSLSPQVVRILRERLLHEQDRIVWQRAMAAIFPDGTDEAAEIAIVALNHQWPDIRLLGCQFIVRHPHPLRGIWLLPLLNDVSPAVMQTAIEGAGLCHNPVVLDGLPDKELTTVEADPSTESEPQSTPAHSRGLRPLLGHAQMPVREAAAVAMCRLGDRQAMQQLQQWSLDANPQIREQAVTAMGASHQGRFIEQLIRQGWTEPDAGVQQAILRSLYALVPEEQRPRGLSPTQPALEAFKVWMEWWKVRSTPDTTAVYPSP
ncbi:MAG: HEAT repeat domain-containing protein, partial [Planctomycetaceae bacterium]